tara:strand:+ start:2157 stop:3203 length:1047 start_codon:yes stop_codon:yes gene_type:complete
MPKKKKTVYVGMSGGVDSSVAAALLQKRGFNVVGVYMKCWTEGPACTTLEDERSARLAALHLGIPFYVWNFIDQYQEKVVEYMLKGYQQGITPNPDMMCNREIKFGLFFQKAMELGADYVATGHYAQTEKRGGNFILLKGVDPEKDQSYFLAGINPAVLEKTLFPIGRYTKIQVRALARKLRLPNAERKDSQGICFVGKVQIGDFLRLHIPKKEGTIVSSQGKVLGQHDGVHYYTLGQRQGLGLAGGPYYVAGKDLATNTLQVTKEEKDVEQNKIFVQDVNWFFRPVENPAKLTVKLRYRQEDIPVQLVLNEDGSCMLKTATPQRAVTPGQFAVFYRNEELLGGGVIQ